jgi:hypothetical protein
VFVLDTGSGISVIKPGVYSSEVKPTKLSPFGVTDKELEIQGIQEMTFHLHGRKFSHQFCVSSVLTEANGIIGKYFLSEKNADLTLEKSQLRLLSAAKFQHGFESQGTGQARGKASHVALTDLLIETAIIVSKNPSRKPGEMRERANRKVSSASLESKFGKENRG